MAALDAGVWLRDSGKLPATPARAPPCAPGADAMTDSAPLTRTTHAVISAPGGFLRFDGQGLAFHGAGRAGGMQPGPAEPANG